MAGHDFIMCDLIAKKRDGGEFDAAEIEFWLRGMLDGSIPDYQTAALLMAIYFRGLSEHETFLLTDAIVRSGEVLNLSHLPGCKADKHSTGGVGDKTTLIAMPLAAACGLTIVKMSGRSLGKTGGTADKLEAVPGFRLTLSPADLQRQAEAEHLVLMTQSNNLTPADKRLYALRDLTATVDSLPLIAASVMSKKIAAGADVIVLDVKFGRGAFMPDAASACKLAELMVKLGRQAGRKIAALITAMEAPLGRAVGNALEVWEAVETLKGHGAPDLRLLSLALTGEQLYLAGLAETRQHGFRLAEQALADGRGLAKFLGFLKAQGGDTARLEQGGFLQAKTVLAVPSPRGGYLQAVDAAQVAGVVQHLGAGRLRVEDKIDYQVGVWFDRQRGDKIAAGEPLAHVYAESEEQAQAAAEALLTACTFGDTQPELPPLIYGAVTAEGFIPWAELQQDYQ